MYKGIALIFVLFFVAFNGLIFLDKSELLSGLVNFLFYISVPMGALLDVVFTALLSGVIDWGKYESADVYVATMLYCLGGCAQYMLVVWIAVKVRKGVQG